MRSFFGQWRSAPAQVLKWVGYGAIAIAAGAFVLGESTTLAQRGRNRNGGGGGGGVQVSGGGNAQVRVPGSGGQVAVPGGGAQVRVPGAGGQVTLPGAGAEIRTPAAGGQVRVPGAGADVRVPSAGADVRVPGAGADVRVPGAGVDVRVPGAGGQVRVPGAGADVRVPGAGGQVRVPGAGADVRVPGTGAGVRVPGGEARTTLRPNLDANVRTGARLEGSVNARVPGGVHIDPSVASQANLRFSPKWANQQVQLDQFRTNLSGAMRSQIRADAANAAANANANVAANTWLAANPNRAQYWNNWGTTARSGFSYGANPFFNYNFWNARNLIGIGLGGYGYGGGYGNGYGGWWGYQPWIGYRPWWYWYGNPGWGGMNSYFAGYGWNQPYYYDYGTGGNVVYSGNQVLVNSQPVGTPVEYAQSAAALAAVDPATVGQTKPEDWMALGTFTLSTAQDERDPARVMQLAVNKNGLISGTSFNKQTGKTYTVQGRVDKDTQRAAFTIGNSTDLVMETGLFNLTQEETPVLAHLGPNKTATYLLARLPEPQHSAEEEVPHTAAVPTLP